MRDGLVRADRLAELLALLRVLDPDLEHALADADGLDRDGGEHARAEPRDVARERIPALRFETAETARRIRRVERVAARVDRPCVPILDHRDPVDEREIRDEGAVERRGPARLA